MIKLDNVTKFFKTEGEKKYILKNVSFDIPEGINLGILGRNGAGKSTFLRMLGGIEFPSSGEITSDKSFSWPMGLAGGFQLSMTGRQNVKFVARIYGRNAEDITRIINSVQEFAEIGDYFDMPMKVYSNGMRSRLSFGLSLAFEFDYLIIDETLSVGDQNFKKKAKDALIKKIENCNILLVSHSMADLKKLCDSGVVLNEGKLRFFNKIDDAIKYYHQLNMLAAPSASNAVQSSAIYCNDGNVFDNTEEAAKFYNQRPYGILQALDENEGSHVYLGKVFWRDGQSKKAYRKWPNVKEKQEVISSDGVVFHAAEEAVVFYRERFPKHDISIEDIRLALGDDEGLMKKINVKFYYLSEYQ